MADISQIKLPSGDTFDIIDEKSGYITAEYIENKTDYSIPVSRVGEIVVGETAIGTDSTNFPTSKAVVDYTDERIAQEIDAIDVGVTSVNGKTGSVMLSASDVGAVTTEYLNNKLGDFKGYMQGQIPTSTSQLKNDSGFITAFVDEKLAIDLFSHSSTNSATYYPILGKYGNSISTAARRNYDSEFKYEFTNGTTVDLSIGSSKFTGRLVLKKNDIITRLIPSATTYADITLPASTGTIALISDIPTKTSDLTNDSGYITSYTETDPTVPVWAKASTKPSYNFSEIGNKPTTLSGYGITNAYTKTEVDGLVSGVLHYKGTKTTISALPTSGNTTGDVWHVTADGSEWAWDGSAWQELGTVIDLSGYAQLSGASFTGPVTFGDSVTADELETGDLVVTGAASFTNNIQANTINGVTVGSSPKFTDTVVSKTSQLTNDSGYLTMSTLPIYDGTVI